MGEGFVKLYSSILDSSVWDCDAETRIVWITLLAMADADGRVHAAIPGIASRARVSIEATQKALELFQSPDPYSRNDKHGGRRIIKDGRDWMLLNFAEHRARSQTYSDKERERKRKWWHENRSPKLFSDKETSETSDSLDGTSSYTEADTYTEAEAEAEIKAKKEYPADFASFWSAYPSARKVGKAAALKAWNNAKRSQFWPGLPAILEALEAQKLSEQWREKNGRFVPLPTTWLNQGRWDDELRRDGWQYHEVLDEMQGHDAVPKKVLKERY